MNRPRPTPFVIVGAFLISLVAGTAVQAQTAAPELMQKLSRAGERFPQANIVFVEKRRDIRYEQDGTYVDRTHCLIKLLTEPAVQYFATLPVWEYYSYRSQAKVEFARVVKPDGTISDVPADLIADVPNPMYRRQNVNDETMRLKTVTFQNLRVGDAVEYLIEERCVKPVTSDFELKEGKYLQEDEPVAYVRIEINGPAGKPLKHMLRCAESLVVTSTSEQKDGRTSYIWEARDIPPFISEPGWNTRQHFAARLLASTIASWSELSRTGYRINQASMDEDDNLRAAVAGATRGLKTNEEKAASLVRFLRSNIGYKGLTSVSAYQGKPATQTLRERFGVCRDVAVLLCSMLRAAGIESYPAATGYGRVFDSEVPHDIFQHMIVAVPDGQRGYRLYDPTAILRSTDRLPGYAGEAPLLVFRPEGEDLVRIPHIAATENLGTIRAESRIGADGLLSSTVTIGGRGAYEEDLRNWCRRTKAEDYRKRWGDIVAQVNPAARVIEVSTSESSDLDTQFLVTIRYEAPGYAAPGSDALLIKTPLASDCFERVLTDIVARAKKPERKYPFILTTTVAAVQEETLLLPPGYSVESTPEPIALEGKDVSLNIRYIAASPAGEANASQLSFKKKLSIDSRQFDPANYVELRKVLEANSSSKNAQVRITPHPSDPRVY
ncbi:MAG: DUF3857 domain-containing protein [Acidobacteria bacterium]|nr:MAG: DUF3857 domain-containing protein [Acidobacteriota bacterium]